MSGTEAEYRDDLGEMDGIGERPLPDFLPPPDQLVRRPGHGQGDTGAEPGQRRLLPRRGEATGRALPADDPRPGRRVCAAAWMSLGAVSHANHHWHPVTISSTGARSEIVAQKNLDSLSPTCLIK